MCDFAKLKDRSFQLKLGTVILGSVVIGLVGSVHNTMPNGENPFLSVNCIGLILSVMFLLGVISKQIPDSVTLKRVEITYHFLTALMIFMTGSVYIYEAMQQHCVRYCTARYLGVFLGFANGILYGLVGWNLLDIKIVSKVPVTA